MLYMSRTLPRPILDSAGIAESNKVSEVFINGLVSGFSLDDGGSRSTSQVIMDRNTLQLRLA